MHTFLNSPTQELFLYIITMFPNAFLLPFTVAQDLQSDLILRRPPTTIDQLPP